MDMMRADEDLISPSASPIHSSGSDDHDRLNGRFDFDFNYNQMLNIFIFSANGTEIDDSISKLQSIEHTNKAPADASNALKLLKHHGISMIEDADGTLLNSALQSGRKLVVSDAGKLILNDPKFKRVFSNDSPKFSPTSPIRSSTVVPSTAVASRQPVSKFTNSIPSNAVKLDALRKKPTIFMPAINTKPSSSSSHLGNGMPLKTNKVIKILSAEEFKQMCGANAGGNTLKRISTESLQNGNLK